MTPPDDVRKLQSFYRLTRPGGPGWRRVLQHAADEGGLPADAHGDGAGLPAGVLCMLLGCVAVYGALFATGYCIYGRYALAAGLGGVAVVAAGGLGILWRRMVRTSAKIGT